ncbi:MAG: bifunctional serine/threonine-protein kinase/formylglycine-generating enzyme family protein [Planctomycetota bacterium]
MAASSDSAERAKHAFAEFLAREASESPADFEGWIAEHPGLESHLRRLRRQYTRVDELFTGLNADSGVLDSAARELRGEASSDEVDAELARIVQSHAQNERYEILEPVDRGGMGLVLRVRDRVLGREVAMKRVRTRGRPEPARIRRFLAEAKLAGRLDHPGIATVHDLGVDAQGRVFFTMPLVRGSTLEDVFERVRRGEDGWSLASALEVVLKVCDAIGYAHSEGVVHRDLKPRNVMVGRFGEAYVVDWGLAHVLGGERDRAIVGTPDFMAPEQADGNSERVDPRSDVYSVGAILHRLLAVGSDDPPAELAAIATKATAHDPAARYADMRAMSDDVRAYLAGRVVRAHERGAWPEAKKWVRRNRALAVAAAGIFVLVVGSLAALSVVEARGKAEVLELADSLRLSELEREADALWPALPARVPALRAWSTRALALSANRARHERALARLGAETSVEARWRRDGLQALIAGIDRLVEPQRGLLADVERRIELAARVMRTSVVEHAADWERACASIANESECPQYRGLRLRPQLGLVPIGRNPQSGLWEFVHVASGVEAGESDHGIVLVLIPGGSAVLGSERPVPGRESGPRTDPLADDDEWPLHTAVVEPFFLAKHELSASQRQRLALASGLRDPYGGVVTARLPAHSISWSEARELLARSALRLPSETECEYAARAGTETRWWCGNDTGSLTGVGNVGAGVDARLPFDDGFVELAPVDALAPNPFGLVSVHGNVAEWTSTRGANPDEQIARGGGWRSSIAESRSAARTSLPAENRSDELGVRAARDIER